MNLTSQPLKMPVIFKGLPTDKQNHFAAEIERLMLSEGKARCTFFDKTFDLDWDDFALFVEENDLLEHLLTNRWAVFHEFCLYYADNRAEYVQAGGIW